MKQKFMHLFLIAGIILLAGSGHPRRSIKSDFKTAGDLTQDEDGWTVITPSRTSGCYILLINSLFLNKDGEAIPDLLAPDSSVTVPGLTHSTEYAVKVSAVDNSGNESGFSDELVSRTGGRHKVLYQCRGTGCRREQIKEQSPAGSRESFH